MTIDPPEFDPSSFRDPAGCVFLQGGRVFRKLNPAGVRIWEDFKNTGLLPGLVERGRLVESWEEADPGAGGEKVLEHRPVPFLSYSYEWPFSLLLRAALLHLDLLEELLPRGFILKDATPFNIQFLGVDPTLIDVLSIERRVEGDPWVGYGQFCDTMLHPLMLSAYKRVPLQPLLSGWPEGIPVETMSRFFGWGDIFSSGVLTHVKMRAALNRLFQSGDSIRRDNIRNAGLPASAILKNVSNLRSVLRRVSRRARPQSVWTTYAENNSYDDASVAKKKEFVDRALSDIRPGLVWDIGCNTGVFSEIAIKHSGFVVSLDSDESAVEVLAEKAVRERWSRLLPLVVDWAAPTPSRGWGAHERKKFFERRKPDVILYLGLLHHLAVTRQVPIEHQMALLAQNSTEGAVVEFIDRFDPMFERLARNIDNHFPDYSRDAFVAVASRFFTIVARHAHSPTREMFLLKSKKH